jgi:hypothetical protein
MGASIEVAVPASGLGDELAARLAEHGFRAEVREKDDECTVDVSYAMDESERLLVDVASAIEDWLGDQMLPLVVETADGGCVLRPPAS